MRQHSEEGSTLIVVVFLVTVLSLLGIGLITTTVADLKTSDSYVRSLKALYTADAGLNDAVSLLQENPTLGDATPNPTGTPLIQKAHYDGSYSIWIWNQRVRGNGVISSFPTTDTRQVIVLGTDGRKASRRLTAVVAPSRRRPKALDYAAFSCSNAVLNGADIEGTIYTRGDLTWSGSTPSSVNAEVYGNYVGTKDLKQGWLKANGTVTNGSSKIELGCRVAGAVGTVSNPGNCKVELVPNVVPVPVRRHCDATSADWDPAMLDLTPAEVQVYRDDTLLADQKPTGWTVTGGAITLPTRVWVVGDVLWDNVDVNWGGDTVLLVDGNFVCNKCKIKEGGAGEYLTIVTSTGNITFTGGESSKFVGVLWAGIWTEAGVPPLAGSITVTGGYDLKIKGEAVATAGPITNNDKFHVYIDAGKPPHFGEVNGYAITEWLETR